jgi:hypothetical protein
MTTKPKAFHQAPSHRGGGNLQITVSWPESVMKTADIQAGRNGETRSGYLRRLVEQDGKNQAQFGEDGPSL